MVEDEEGSGDGEDGDDQEETSGEGLAVHLKARSCDMYCQNCSTEFAPITPCLCR